MGKTQSFNDIANERFQRNQSMTLNTLPMNKYGVRETKLAEQDVDEQAECLVKMFDAPNSKPLYCDAVRYLTRSFLEEKANYALHHAKTTPARLFGHIVYKKLYSIGLYH